MMYFRGEKRLSRAVKGEKIIKISLIYLQFQFVKRYISHSVRLVWILYPNQLVSQGYSDTIICIIPMSPYLPHILPQTKQRSHERGGKKGGKKKKMKKGKIVSLCVFSIICSLGNYAWLLNQSPLL